MAKQGAIAKEINVHIADGAFQDAATAIRQAKNTGKITGHHLSSVIKGLHRNHAFSFLRDIADSTAVQALRVKDVTSLTSKFMVALELQAIEFTVKHLANNQTLAKDVISSVIDQFTRQENGGYYAGSFILSLLKYKQLNPIITPEFVSEQIDKFISNGEPKSAANFIEQIIARKDLRPSVSQEQFDTAATLIRDAHNNYTYSQFINGVQDHMPSLINNSDVVTVTEKPTGDKPADPKT